MSKKGKLYINTDKKVPLVIGATPPKQGQTDLVKSVRLYIRIK